MDDISLKEAARRRAIVDELIAIGIEGASFT